MKIKNRRISITVFCRGFTLVELLVSIALTGLVFSAIWSTFTAQQSIYIAQKQITAMQQNLRAARFMLEKEIRMAGYDTSPHDQEAFQITDIRLRDENNSLDINGNSAITFTAGDYNNSGSNKTISYSKNGPTTLARAINGSGRQLFAENIQAFALAYAFDENRDGNLDTSAGGNIIWAVDTDNDNFLDLSLDTGDDGTIDENDDTDNDGTLEGFPLNPAIGIDRIRVVRIWLLGRTTKPDKDYSNNGTVVVGRAVITTNDRIRRRLLTTMVRCRNLGI